MNCRKGRIVEYDTDDRTILYSFHLADQQDCEFDRFIKKFNKSADDPRSIKERDDMQIIISAIGEIMKRGAREGRFRSENNVHALPSEACGLRLYCIRLHSEAVLIGNGGVKTSQKLQDSPDCYPHYQLLSELERQITIRIRNKDIQWNGDYLSGDFYFELGDCE